MPLQLLDNVASRRYLEMLQEAREAALAVDRERHGSDGPAVFLVDQILAEVELEVHGPGGRVLE